jgi:hypothetical protein
LFAHPGHAAAIDRRLAVLGAQDQERILAEEGIPPDVLTAFENAGAAIAPLSRRD